MNRPICGGGVGANDCTNSGVGAIHELPLRYADHIQVKGRFVNRPYGFIGWWEMKYNPDTHHRRSIRLRDYDYSSAGAYFVTICTSGRECLLADVVDGEIRLNDAGLCVKTIWDSLPEKYSDVEVDSVVIMPNHIHGIIIIDETTVGAIHELPSPSTQADERAIHESPLRDRRKMTLPKIIGYLKMNTAKRINQLRDNSGTPVWQRNYYERVIRNDHELQNMRQYIDDNPIKWAEDENHPSHL
jgi:REP element-mobilizing transposase RayT